MKKQNKLIMPWKGDTTTYNNLEGTILKKKCKIVLGGRKIMDYRLDYIKIKNYKLFENEVELSLRTDRQFQNDISAETKIWDTSTKVKTRYKKVVGIWGKNASGKSSILNAFNFWLAIFRKFNTFDESFMRLPFNNEQWLLSQKINESQKNRDIAANSYFYNPEEPVEVELGFSTKGMSFSYRLSEKNVVRGSESLTDTNEELKIWNSKGTLYEWKGILDVKKIFNMVIYYNSLVKSKEYNALSDKSEKYKYLYQNLFTYALGKLSKDKLDDIIENADYIIEAYRIMVDFTNDNITLKVHDITGSNPGNVVSTIDTVLTNMHVYYGVSKEEIEKVMNWILHSLDDSAKEIKFDYIMNNNAEIVRMLCIKSWTGNSYFAEQLSAGTLFFMLVAVDLWSKDIANKVNKSNETKYLLIDELGANWHTNLTESFINMIEADVFGKTTVVFTSHDAELGNYVTSDSINVMTNNKQLTRISSLVDEETAVRRNINFSKDYLNDALDTYNSNPDLIYYDALKEMINKDAHHAKK